VRHTNYDDIAAEYDRRYDEEDYTGIERALVDFIGNQGAGILEVGCGTGHWLRTLQARRIRAIGADLSRQMLLGARTKTWGIPLIRARAEALPFSSSTLDRIFSINAHHHFSDKLQFIREARRVLRPSGSVMAIALDPHSGTDRWWVYDYFEGTREIDMQRYPSCAQIRAWMGEAGFVHARTCEVQHIPGDICALEAFEKGMISRSRTSQLAVLTETEFAAGMERIRVALKRTRSLRLSADLRVYATYGSVP